MLKNYLITAMRSLAHHRLYTLINVVGLSIALAAAILIGLYVRDELSYDKWLPHARDLYRLEATSHIPGLPVTPLAMASFPLVTAIGEKSPQVKAVTHMMPESLTVKVGDRDFREEATFVDPNFLRVIELPLVRGDPARVLAQPESVVISQRIAHKYFGDTDPIGRTLNVSKDPFGASNAAGSTWRTVLYPLTVTGVLRDLPHNTQLLADLVVTNTSQADRLSARDKEVTWRSLEGDYGYVELRPGANPAAVLAELKPILNASWNPRAIGVDLSPSELQQYRLTPFLNVHLASDKYGGMEPPGS
jgi:putative ABC transport system permease protein